MVDFLQTIEHEYSRLRGRQSLLSPIDWQLASGLGRERNSFTIGG